MRGNRNPAGTHTGTRTGMLVAAIGSILCVAVIAAGAASADRQAGEPGSVQIASAALAMSYPAVARMSSHGAASTDPARSKAEIDAWHYNSSYLFGLSRGTANSALLPAFKPFVFLVTVPLDLALLPIAALGGLFG